MRIRGVIALAAALTIGPPSLLALDPHKLLSQYTTAVWTQAQGLPQDGIRAMAQTPDGYLWLGTDEGLTRFDGYDFVTYTRDHGALPGNTILALATATDGTLWIGTPNGLVSYRAGKFTTFTTKDGLPDNFIISLLAGNDGTVWIAGGISLSHYLGGKFVNYPAEILRPLEAVRAVYEDRRGTLWISGTGGLVKQAGNNFVKVLGPEQMPEPIVTTITGDSKGNIWLGTGKGITRVSESGAVRHFSTADGLPDDKVRVVHEDRDGNMWAGTDGGLARLEGDHFTSLTRNARPADWVRSMFEDREGNLWVGMNSGLMRFRDDLFAIYGRGEGLPSDEPVAVHQDRHGEIWVGYHTGGLVAFHDGHPRIYTTRDGLPSNEIYSIREDSSGDLLIATRNGLVRMLDGHFFLYSLPHLPGRPVVFDSLEDRFHQLWVAGAGGLYTGSGTTFRAAVPAVPGGPMANDSAVAVSETTDGSIWAGTYGEGLWRIQSDKSKRFTEADGLGSDRIRALHADSDGTLWIGTFGGGLTEWRDGVFRVYRAKDGLLSDNISHIEDDGKGTLWLSTTRGICRISRQQLHEFVPGRLAALTPVNYGFQDGLRSTQCSPGYPVGGGGTRSADGRLWFPTGQGLAVLDPAAADTSHHPGAPSPIVHLLEVNAHGRKFDPEQPAQMAPGLDHIQFRYAGIHLTAPERVSYEYKLEGLDPDWIAAAGRRTIDYNSLRQGLYTFRVRATVPGAPPDETSLSLTVLPHFYERQSFLWLCGVAAVALMFVLYQLHLKQIRERLALVFEERARMAREIHDTLAQGVVGISSQLDAVAIMMNGRDGTARTHLELAQKMARHSLTEAKRSVMDLRASPLKDRDLASALASAVQQWKAGFPIRIDMDISGPRRVLPEDVEQNVLRIAQEAVTNVLKHAHATAIRIQLQIESRKLTLTVKDDGAGFTPASVFSAQGGHFGLLGMRERAERIGGELDFSSTPGEGTAVRVSVPLAPESVKLRGWLRRFAIAERS